VFLGAFSFSFIQIFLLQGVLFSLSTLHHRQMDRQTTLSCSSSTIG